MAGIVEYIIKMQDGLTVPLTNISGRSDKAKKSLTNLTASNAQLKSMVGHTSTSVSDLNTRIDKLRALRDILPDHAKDRIRQVNREIADLNQQVEKLQGLGTGGLKKGFDGFFATLPRFFRNPFILAGAGLTGALNTGLKNSRDKLDFKLLMGKDAGAQFFNTLKKDAPAAMKDIFVAGGKQLVSSGMDIGSTQNTLEQVGNISLGNEDRFNGVLTAFSQIRNEGKLTESSLQQLNDSGFKPLVTLNKATGESMESLRKRFEDGKISVKDIQRSFEAATAPGGEFHNKLQEIADSPTGKWDVFKDKALTLTSTFGDALLPVFTKGIDLLSTGFDWLNTGIDWTIKILGDLGGWVDKNSTLIYTLSGAVLGGVVAYKAYQAVSMLVYLWQMRDLVSTSLLATAKGGLSVVTSGLTIAQSALNAAFIASPIGWVVLGVGALAGGIVYAWNKFEGFRKVVYGLWDAFKETFTSIGRLFKQIFSPIFDAIAAIKEHRWADAAKATGKLLYNLTPMGLAAATAEFTQSGGFDGISKAFGEGAEKGAKSFQESKEKKQKAKDQEDLFTSPDTQLLDYLKKNDAVKNTGDKANAGINAVSGGGMKNVTITINKLLDNTNIVVQNGVKQMGRDIEKIVQESLIRAVASASGR